MKVPGRLAMLVLLSSIAACKDTAGSDEDTGSTSVATTTTDTTESSAESSSGSTSGDSGSTEDSAADTTTGDATMTCGLQCTSAVDCCVLSGTFGCEDAIGIYPNNFECGPEGTCSNHGCASTADCSMFDTADVHFVCVARDDFSTCEVSCAEDGDCFLAGPMYACTGEDAEVGGYCEPPQCSNDDECTLLGERCIEGDCQFSCTADEDCANGGTCDVASGACVCTSDGECTDGWACAPAQ